MQQVQVEKKGAVLEIAINRPEKKNALTAEMYGALADAVEQAESDTSVRVLLLHGVGETFTAGNDLQDFLQQPWKGQENPPAVRFIYSVARAQKPIVAAVRGLAVGVGLTILLHCDLVYAAEDARFMAPFVDLGIVPEAGSTLLLPAMMGHQRAAELLLLGSPCNAQRAYELGLVNAVTTVASVLPTARAAAQKLAEKPAAALRASKRLMKQGTAAALEAVMRAELEAITQRLESPETKEALSAFLEKRKPDFSKFQ